MTSSAILTRSAPLPATLDETDRTVEATLSTGAAYQRRDASGPFIEMLEITPDAVDLSRLIGAPLLDGHQATRSRDVLGRVQDARVEGGALVGRLQFSDRADVQDIWRDVVAGHLRNLSVGYRVSAWRQSRDDQGRRIMTATRWTPHEVSIVPLPADPGAQFRGTQMPEADTVNTAPDTGAAPLPDTGPTLDRTAVNGEIRNIATLAGLDRAWADSQIDAGATVETARAAAFDAMRHRSGPPIITVGYSSDDPAVRTRALAGALTERMAPSANGPDDYARQFMGRSLAEMARFALEMRGERIGALTPDGVLERAMHGTTDFSVALSEAGRRVLLASYEAAPSPVKALARRTTATDFRSRSTVRMSGLGTLDRVHEHGEITHGTRSEMAESYKVETYAKLFSLTRQAIVNDDLGSLADWATAAGQAAAATEAALLVNLMVSNPTMADGKALFHADHGNTDTGAALSDTALSAARLAMRTQTGPDGTPIHATPKTLLVGPALETTAEKMLATIYPADVSSVNPHAGRLTLAVEPRLSGSGWYVFADPTQAPVLEYAHLTGREGPQLSTRDGWGTLGMEFRVVLDFGAGVIGHQGAYFNAGS